MQKRRFSFKPQCEQLENRNLLSVMNVVHEALGTIHTLQMNQASAMHDLSMGLASDKSQIQSLINQTNMDLKTAQNHLLADTQAHNFSAITMDLQDINMIRADLQKEQHDLIGLNVAIAGANAALAQGTAQAILATVNSEVDAIVHHMDMLTHPSSSMIISDQQSAINSGFSAIDSHIAALVSDASMAASDAHSIAGGMTGQTMLTSAKRIK